MACHELSVVKTTGCTPRKHNYLFGLRVNISRNVLIGRYRNLKTPDFVKTPNPRTPSPFVHRFGPDSITITLYY